MKLTDTKNIMVYVETDAGSPASVALEALAAARKIAETQKQEILAVVIDKKSDEDIKKIFAAGADKVILVEDEEYQNERYEYIFKQLIEKYKPSVFMAGSTLLSKDIVGVIAAYFETTGLVDVVNIAFEGEQIILTCPVYGGTILNDIKVLSKPVVMTVRPGAFSKEFDDSRNGEVVVEKIEVPENVLLTKIADVIREATDTINLEEADVIVSVGRGMGSKENCALAQELADVCGGVLGGTRPAIEDEWIARCYQVGQSGKIVSPKLYIACGISGATQHVSGMVGSGYIIAINKDEDAPIFDVADVGIVGDVTKVLPLLIEEFKKLKA